MARRSAGVARAALVLSVPLCLRAPAPLLAQCPDGTPPPCVSQAARPAARRPPDDAARRRSFLVLPFRNISRASQHDWLVEGSPVMLAEVLGRREDLTLVPDERLYPALRRAGLVPGEVMDLARVRRVAAETGGWTAVTGEIIAIGERLRVSARAFDVVTNREVTRAQEEVRAAEDIRNAYERLGTSLLRAAGVDTGAARLAATTTGSLEAYRAYLRGLSHMNRSEARQARAAFLEAVRLDSTFAQAYARLAEASFNVRPEELADARSQSYQYAARAAALSARLPQHDRTLVQVINDLFLSHFTSARQALGQLIAADSTDVDALEWLANIEGSDMILAPVPGGMRPRGSINAVLRLSKRVLELDPSRHQMYQNLVLGYAIAGGYGIGLRVGFEREAASLAQLLNSPPSRVFVPLVRDTIELVPADSAAAIPPDTLAASRRRALAVARSWADRWGAAAPAEAEAHLWSSRMLELAGEYGPALRELERADSLGVETGLESVPIRRMSLLAQLGRIGDARRIADSLWTAGTITFAPITGRAIEAAGWTFNLFLADGAFDVAGALIERLAAALPPTPQVLTLSREGTSAAVLSGATPRGSGGIFSMAPDLRARLFEAALARAVQAPPSGTIARLLPWLLQLARSNQAPALRARLNASAVDAALALGVAGGEDLAYDLAAEAVAGDSTQRTRLAAVTWYASRQEEQRALRLQTQQQFRPTGARVSGTQAVFEWQTPAGATFTWNRLGTPATRSDFIWTVDLEAGGTHYELLLDRDRTPGSMSRTGTLADLLGASTRLVHLVPADTTHPHRDAPGVRLAVEPSPAGFRMVLSDTTIVAALRRERPATVRFRFRPCEPDPASPCVDERIPVMYP